MSRLLVLGNAGLDIVLPVPRLPRPGETLVGGGRATAPGGKGLNQAVVAARTGLVPVCFHAPLGDDAEADRVEAALRREGFAALTLPRLPVATDLSVVVVAPDGENCVVTSGGCADAFGAAEADAAARTLRRGEWLLLQGNLSAAATEAAVRAAAASGVRCVLNAAPPRWDVRPLLAGFAAVVANAVEARDVTGLDGPAAARALRDAGAALAVVTLGAGGCLVASGEGTRHLPAPAARAVDSTGAGDAFCGVFAAWLAAGRPWEAAAAAAQRAAALSVARPGAFVALPTAAELYGLAHSV